MEDVQKLFRRVEEFLENEENHIFNDDKAHYVLYKGVIDADRIKLDFFKDNYYGNPTLENRIMIQNELLKMLDPIEVQFENATKLDSEHIDDEDFEEEPIVDTDLEDYSDAEIEDLLNSLTDDLTNNESSLENANQNETVSSFDTNTNEVDIDDFTDDELDDLLNSLTDDFEEVKLEDLNKYETNIEKKEEESLYPTGLIDNEKITELLNQSNDTIAENSFAQEKVKVENSNADKPNFEEIDFSMFDDLFE